MNEPTQINAPYELTTAEDPNAQTSVEDVQNTSTTESVMTESTETTETTENPVITPETATRENATEALQGGGLDIASFEAEYANSGSLTDASYEKLAKAGISRQVVDAYINGQETVFNNFVSEVQGFAGGEENYKTMTEWAKQNLSQEEQLAFNSVCESGNKAMIKFAVQGLVSRHRTAEGHNPQLMSGRAQSGGVASGGFTSSAEMKAAMRDPRYGTDRAYTNEVEQRTARASFFS